MTTPTLTEVAGHVAHAYAHGLNPADVLAANGIASIRAHGGTSALTTGGLDTRTIDGVTYYRCPECGTWTRARGLHIGHRPGFTREALREAVRAVMLAAGQDRSTIARAVKYVTTKRYVLSHVTTQCYHCNTR